MHILPNVGNSGWIHGWRLSELGWFVSCEEPLTFKNIVTIVPAKVWRLKLEDWIMLIQTVVQGRCKFQSTACCTKLEIKYPLTSWIGFGGQILIRESDWTVRNIVGAFSWWLQQRSGSEQMPARWDMCSTPPIRVQCPLGLKHGSLHSALRGPPSKSTAQWPWLPGDSWSIACKNFLWFQHPLVGSRNKHFTRP